jgi:hypothetical protein
MRKASAALLMACTLTACESHSAANQNAIQALGSTVPASRFDRRYWQREHDTNPREWLLAKQLCEQTVLATYPNCLPVNDIVQIDHRNKADAGNRAAQKIGEMGRLGYGYDYVRKEWLLDRDMLTADCRSVPAYSENPARSGFYTWQCPAGETIPKGIPDLNFSKEEEDATN